MTDMSVLPATMKPSARQRIDAEVDQARPARRLMAIVFTDMAGYTALMGTDERRARLNRDRQRAVIESAVDRHGGQIVEFVGDGTLSVFESAVRAVQCAVDIQASLAEAPRVPLRIGIHSGDIVYDDAGVFGDGVNVSARIQDLACPGGILISDKVYDEVKNQPEIQTRSVGTFNLKNVRRRVPVHAVVAEHLSAPSHTVRPPARRWDGESVAVLPFVNMSSDPQNDFLCDGITDDLTNALTELDDLRVVARTSSFAFKGANEDVRIIATRLGVSMVFEGSVRRVGDRLRVRAQLIDAREGYVLFSATYDRTLGDVLSLQGELARTIVDELRSRMRRGAAARGSQGRARGEGWPSAVAPTEDQAEPLPLVTAALSDGAAGWN